jgi:tyrosine-protein phosphatase non-receptor type 23
VVSYAGDARAAIPRAESALSLVSEILSAPRADMTDLLSTSRRDAFTSKPISQHSLAYEKASIIFNIASILSSLGARTNRLTSGISSPSPASAAAGPAIPFQNADGASTSATGTKLAYTSLRQAAGMLSYINDNFLHAPSSDMSKDVIRWLVDVQLAQATEVFWERTLEEKKGGSLVARLAAQVTLMYSALAEEAKEWVGRSIFEKSWALLVQVSFVNDVASTRIIC